MTDRTLVKLTQVTVVTLAASVGRLFSRQTGDTMRYKDLVVWQRAMDLVVNVYRCTKAFSARRNVRTGLHKCIEPRFQP